MGRGRAKAKQTKVARELKYSSGGTDLDRLRAELVSGEPTSHVVEEDEPDEDDPYAKYAADDGDDEFADERRSG
ncbi:MAG TPA: DUF3073 domain-containing protein [Sporichthyaceae bacterium]|jgi:hypothetical protein|nr:DUF3073 domain-containing protein [Sporichthyaceae bacterium]